MVYIFTTRTYLYATNYINYLKKNSLKILSIVRNDTLAGTRVAPWMMLQGFFTLWFSLFSLTPLFIQNSVFCYHGKKSYQQ